MALKHGKTIDSLLQQSIARTILQRYDEALAPADSVIALAPDEPIGHLFRAAVLQARMLDYETFEDEKLFLKATSNCRKLAQQRLRKRPQEAWAHFFLGSALGYESFFLGKKRRHVEAFRTGWQCLQHLEAALRHDPSFYDAYLGIGTYKYYRSKFSKNLTWLPFVEDEREEGISMIRQAIAKGCYSRYAAINGLAWILMDESRPEEALALVDSALTRFPNSRFFLWAAAEASRRVGQYDRAIAHYQQILRSLQNERRLSPYLEVVGRTKLARVYAAANQTDEACREMARVNEVKLSGFDRERGGEMLKEAATYLQNCGAPLTGANQRHSDP
jgi:tetratricopeptide (TPR) repeat protein